jgi:dTMP kinase
MPRPAFISLDGIDGTGKSTQCRLLAEWLAGQKVPVTTCTDPGGTALGQQLRQLVLFGREHRIATTTEAFLFLASRAQLVDEVIRPALDRGEVVISDRFTLANVVYQGHAGGLNPDDLWRVGAVATGGLEPDLTLVFDLPLDVAFTRRGRDADRMEERDREYHEAVKRGFTFEAGRRPGPFQIVDATPDEATVQRAARYHVARLLADFGWSVSGE